LSASASASASPPQPAPRSIGLARYLCGAGGGRSNRVKPHADHASPHPGGMGSGSRYKSN
jgi:hypothetical protein